MSRRLAFAALPRAILKQTYWRLATDMGGPARSMNLRAGKPPPFHAEPVSGIFGDPKIAQALLKGHFTYGGQSVDVGAQGDPWTISMPSERFALWLHSFVWLDDLAVSKDKSASVRGRELVDRWIDVYGTWNSYAWDNHVLTHRLYAWFVHWGPILSADSLSDKAQMRRIAAVRQLKRLRITFKRTQPGITRLRAAAVLVLGGARLSEKSETLLNQGLDLLDDEIDLQILPDGGHISRSPAQTIEALEILLSVDGFLQSRDIEPTRTFSRAIERLSHILPFFTSGDGGLPCFHGTGEGDRRRLTRLLKRLDGSTKPFTYCPHTGFQRIAQGDSIIHVDTGSSPDYPFDTEAHLAPGAFELSNAQGRLIVNCGWNPRQPAHWRRSIRATAAHSTLTLGDRNAGELRPLGWGTRLWGDILKAPAGPTHVSRKEQAVGVWLEVAHSGYLGITGLDHRRRFFIDPEGKDIRGEDTLYVPIGKAPISREEIDFDIRFHLHPSVRVTLAQDQQSALLIQSGNIGWRFRTDGGPLKIEPSAYLGMGEKPMRSEQIVISGRAYSDSDGEIRSNRVRWSLRRLEARK